MALPNIGGTSHEEEKHIFTQKNWEFLSLTFAFEKWDYGTKNNKRYGTFPFLFQKQFKKIRIPAFLYQKIVNNLGNPYFFFPTVTKSDYFFEEFPMKNVGKFSVISMSSLEDACILISGIAHEFHISWIADVAVVKGHQRLSEILIFSPKLHPGNQHSCLQENSVMQYTCETCRNSVPVIDVCTGFIHHTPHRNFVVNNFADFRMCGYKKIKDFVQLLDVFCYSNISGPVIGFGLQTWQESQKWFLLWFFQSLTHAVSVST